MTTEKWQLYSQTGVDGPEYGVRIRTGYTVVGFQKEDAQAIVAWQNASIQPEGDIMERAKAALGSWEGCEYDHCKLPDAVEELIAEVERLRSENKIISDRAAHHEKQDAAEIELLAARIKELEAEVEAKNKQIKELQDIIDKPPEDADWVADYHLLQSALDGPIIDAARKWHAAYRKAQNSNLMRAKEVERLRSENRELKKTDVWANDVIKEHESLNARINRLEAEAQEYHDKKEEALTLCAGQNRYIERLEAEFLEATKEIVYAIHEGRDAPEGEDVYAEKVAREALERIKEDGKDEEL